MPDMTRWKGKTAMVTGASSGIGRAISFALARHGVNVALVARRYKRLETIKHEIIHNEGGDAMALIADLSDANQIGNAFDAVRRKWGGVDLLINSAGIGRVAPLMSGTPELFKEMLDVNVLAVAVTTRLAIGDMQRRGKAGHIINISSMSAHRIQSGFGMYAATKHAVRALTEGLRLELRRAGSPIRVSSVSPGDTDTEFLYNMYGDDRAVQENRPSYPMMTTEDVVQAVMYILSTPPHVEVHDILLRPTDQPD